MDKLIPDFRMLFGYAAKRGDLDEFRKLIAAGGEIPSDLSSCEQAEWLIGAIGSDRADEFLDQLLAIGLDPSSVWDCIGDGYQSTAFVTAAKLGRLDLMEKLMAAGANIHWKSPTGANAASAILPSLSRQDPQDEIAEHKAVRQWLDEHGVHLDPCCADSRRKLQYAASGPQSWPDVPMLISLGIDEAVLKWTPFMMKIAMGTATTRDAYEMPSEELSWRDSSLSTPFLFAVEAGRKDLAEVLLERGSDLLETGWCGASALHLAARNGQIDLMEWLIHRGIPIEIHDEHQQPPLRCANERAVRFLLTLGADAYAADSLGYRAIHDASELEIIQPLVEAGADVNAISGGGSWPLLDACRSGDSELAAFLLENGAIPDLTSTGETAMHTAVVSDSIACVNLLLDAGASINARDVDGWTCLWYAKSVGMARHLLAKGADPSLADMYGELPENHWLPLEVSWMFREWRLSFAGLPPSP